MVTFFLSLNISLSADKTSVYLDGGVYKTKFLINSSLVLPFVIDSGAYTVLLPKDVFFTLLRTGTISESDIIRKSYSINADGSRSQVIEINLREIQIGKTVLHNVKAAVSNTAKGKLLLGQSALRRLEPWQLDTKHKVFYFHKNHQKNLENKKPKRNFSSGNINFSDLFIETNVGEIIIEKPTFSIDQSILTLKISMKSKLTYAKGGLSISFPQFQEPNFINYAAQDNFISLNYYSAGSLIYSGILHKTIYAKYLLVEGWEQNWSPNNVKTITIQLNTKSLPTELVVLVRGVLIANNVEYKLPEQGFIGQQGYYNRIIKIPKNK